MAYYFLTLIINKEIVMGMVFHKNLKSIMVLGFIIFFASLGTTAEIDSFGWKFEKEENEITIHTRSVENLLIKEFKASLKMKTTVRHLVDLYFNVSRCSEWRPGCDTSRLLEKVNETTFNIYMAFDNPWPIDDRDYVIQNKLTRNPDSGEVVITFQDLKKALPEQDCCLRMNRVEGMWTFTPTDDHHVVVTFQSLADPGGSLPTSVIEGIPTKLPYATLVNMNKLVQQD